MNNTNFQTLQSYEGHVEEYVSGTADAVSGASKDWIDAALHGLPVNSAILELGSAFGRDAAYIEQQGYTVECSDAAQGFVEHLQRNGFRARLLNVLTGPVPEGWDLILANAVFLHFTRPEFQAALAKMAKALKPQGRLAFSLKQGDGEEWSNAKLNAPRYFCYWQPEALPPLLRQAGFSRWDIKAVATSRKHADWIYVIASI